MVARYTEVVARYAEVVARYAEVVARCTQKWLLGCRLIIKIMSTDTDISIPLEIGTRLQKFLSVKVHGV